MSELMLSDCSMQIVSYVCLADLINKNPEVILSHNLCLLSPFINLHT